MMKKKYITPTIELTDLYPMRLLSGSGANNSDRSIDYGGVDTEGTIDPAAPALQDMSLFFE